MVPMEPVDVTTLGPNESPLTDQDLSKRSTDDAPRHWARSPFVINEGINAKVVLYDGPVERLRAGAFVNPNNENLSQLDLVRKLAGPELESYIRKKVKVCSTGDVRLTPGFNSKFDFIIHAVPPKYQPKYKTAAETALFHTYFRVLEVMIENKIRSAVIPPLATSKCNLPIYENIELQLRIIRRILEKKSDEFDKIVVLVENKDQFAVPFFCYFPTTQIDEDIACYYFGYSIGGQNGEPIIPEREIRIKSKPAVLDPHNHSIDLTSGLDLSTCVGKTTFSKMHDDLDKQRLESNKSDGNRNQVALKKNLFRGCNLL